MEPDPLTRIKAFLDDIGIAVHEGVLDDTSFLPGVTSRGNSIIYDADRLQFPGDLLHEAGHLALMSPPQRAAAGGDFGTEDGLEMAAIAWSHAAATHLGLPLDCVFHEGGYRGDAGWLRDLFGSGKFIGVPVLEWKGLCRGTAYPTMNAWLSQE